MNSPSCGWLHFRPFRPARAAHVATGRNLIRSQTDENFTFKFKIWVAVDGRFLATHLPPSAPCTPTNYNINASVANHPFDLLAPCYRCHRPLLLKNSLPNATEQPVFCRAILQLSCRARTYVFSSLPRDSSRASPAELGRRGQIRLLLKGPGGQLRESLWVEKLRDWLRIAQGERREKCAIGPSSLLNFKGGHGSGMAGMWLIARVGAH